MPMTQDEVDDLRAQVATLNQMIADAVRSVTIGGQTTTFNTTASLIQARNDAQSRLNDAEAEITTGRRAPRAMLYTYGGRGYSG